MRMSLSFIIITSVISLQQLGSTKTNTNIHDDWGSNLDKEIEMLPRKQSSHRTLQLLLLKIIKNCTIFQHLILPHSYVFMYFANRKSHLFWTPKQYCTNDSQRQWRFSPTILRKIYFIWRKLPRSKLTNNVKLSHYVQPCQTIASKCSNWGKVITIMLIVFPPSPITHAEIFQ